MKLKIENWITEQNFSKKVEPLFEEAIKSYRATAYSASLLFSYLCFMTILKERLLNSANPPGIPNGMWNTIIQGIRNKESWDKKIFESTQTQKPASVFQISSTLRREVVYWKDRRNDCAHFKHEKIDYHHVESFWSFMETNISKFSVNGGRASLLTKFINYFDETIKAQDESIKPLIKEIEHAVEESELTDFFSEIRDKINDLWDSKHFKIYNEVFNNYDSIVTEELVKHLKSDESMLIDFMRNYPEKINRLDLSSPFIRSLWFNKLFRNRNNDFSIFVSLLRNNLIRAEDRDEAILKIVNSVYSQIPKEDSEKLELIRQGYFDKLKNRILPEDGIFKFAISNSYKVQIVYYLKNFDIDENTVKSLSKTFSTDYPPFDLEDKLRKFFRDNADKRNEFVQVTDNIDDFEISENLEFIKDLE